jgi:hypothetical protein
MRIERIGYLLQVASVRWRLAALLSSTEKHYFGLWKMTSEFLHYLRDTILLLGGGAALAEMVERAESASDSDVDELRRINCRLIDATKERLANLNKISIVGQGSHRQN